jgi:hypothetical protein
MSRVPMASDGGAWAMDPATAIATDFIPQGISADLIATRASGRMVSSRSRTCSPFWSFTGITDPAKRPSSQARAARWWLWTANSSSSRRVKAMDPATAIATDFIPQGISADLIATREGFTRRELDEFAVQSRLPARAHAGGNLVHGLQPGAAEAVELHAGHSLGHARLDRGGAGDIRTPRGLGKPRGSLHEVKPVDLLGGLLDSLRERHPDMDPAGIEDIVLGCVTLSASAGAVMEGPSWRFGRWGCVVRQDSGW